MDDWAFRVTIHNHEYKIWANGEIAGFPLCGGAVVVNKIPQLIAEAVAARSDRKMKRNIYDEIDAMPQSQVEELVDASEEDFSRWMNGGPSEIEILRARISELESQLEAEGAHTAAANETIDRLQRGRP